VRRGRLAGLLGVLGRALVRAHRDGVARRASALAYSTLLSLVPLLAVVSIFVAQALREDQGRTVQLLAQLLPYREEAIVSALSSFVAQAESVSSLALIGFLLTSLLTFFSVQETLFAIFGVTAPPRLGRRVVTFSLLFFWGPVLIGSVYAGVIYLGQSDSQVANLVHRAALVSALPTLVTFVGLTMLFKRAAYGRIGWRHAAAGSATATVLLELLKFGFSVYVTSFTPVQRAVYGSFAIALFFVLSVQLAWWMLLYGAEVAAILGRPAAELDASRGQRPDPWVALAALSRLGLPGRPTLTTDALAAELALPADAIGTHLRPLVERGLLESPITPSGDWRLAVAPGRVRLDAVFAAYDPGRLDAGAAGAPPAVAALATRLAGARAEALAGATLDDWLHRARRATDSGPPEPRAALVSDDSSA